MSDDMQEIISRPPSHPIATTLLVLSMLGTIASIAIVWSELFGEYLPAPPQGQKNDSLVIAEQSRTKHYEQDFKGSSDDLIADIEKELGVSSTVGMGPN